MGYNRLHPAAFGRRTVVAVGVLLVAFAFASCGDDGAGETTTVPDTLLPPGAVIAEFETPDGERYRALLEGGAAETARLAFAEGEHPGIPNGLIRPGDGGVNLGHDWHVTEVEFADFTMEVCDGTVSYIDDLGYLGFVDAHGDRFCPWMAVLVDLIEP